jgi:histidine triad (HIT) family protein
MMKEQQCLLCGIVDNAIPSKKIYEDDDVIAILDFNGAAPGHTFVIPKQHVPILEQLPNFIVGKLFNLANKISSAIFDQLKVQGTNLFVTNGVAAGQKVAHSMVQVIPRTEHDKAKLDWVPKQLSEEEMSTIELKLKEEVAKVGMGADVGLTSASSSGSPPAAVAGATGPGVASAGAQPMNAIVAHDDEENYLLKQVRRIP